MTEPGKTFIKLPTIQNGVTYVRDLVPSPRVVVGTCASCVGWQAESLRWPQAGESRACLVLSPPPGSDAMVLFPPDFGCAAWQARVKLPDGRAAPHVPPVVLRGDARCPSCGA